MTTMRTAQAKAALAVFVVVAAGCGGSNSSAPTTRGASTLPSAFTIAARFSAQSLGLSDPRALAIGPDGNVYVTDRTQRVTVVSPEGEILRRWGRPGRGAGEFRFVSTDPSAPKDVHGKIAVASNGMVYVSDSGNARVQVFTPQGRFVRQFGSYGNGTGQFISPFDLLVDDAGDVYVVDDSSRALSKFSPKGKVLWRIGGNPSGDPDLAGHFHLASIDAHGRLVIANDDRGRIIYVDRNGHKVDVFGRRSQFPSGACGVTVDAAGTTFVTSCVPGPTLVFDRTHRLVAESPGSNEPIQTSPSFGPNSEVFALGWDGSVLKLHIVRSAG
jgi:outer membrane protein assembly factor BamB